MATMQFQKATRKKSKLRCLVGGVSGSGKSYSSLLLAQGLGERIAVIDTERGSASLYSDLTEFDSMDLEPPYTPERYIEAIQAAEAGGYGVLIIDSLTHVWDGAGGCIDINDATAVKFKGNTWSAWSQTTPRYRALLDAILQSPMHVICTSRMKTETVQGDDKKVRKIGMKNELRQGTEYEFTTVFEIDHEKHLAMVTKDRTNLFPQPMVITRKTGETLRAWLDSGADFAPQGPPPDFIKRDKLVARVKEILENKADLTEEALAEAILKADEVLQADQENFSAVFALLTWKEQQAYKTYASNARAAREKVLANGRAA